MPPGAVGLPSGAPRAAKRVPAALRTAETVEVVPIGSSIGRAGSTPACVPSLDPGTAATGPASALVRWVACWSAPNWATMRAIATRPPWPGPGRRPSRRRRGRRPRPVRPGGDDHGEQRDPDPGRDAPVPGLKVIDALIGG